MQRSVPRWLRPKEAFGSACGLVGGCRTIPDQRLWRDIDVARPDDAAVVDTHPTEDEIVGRDRCEDAPAGKQIGQVALDHGAVG